jgi:FkbM family methyltransferase
METAGTASTAATPAGHELINRARALTISEMLRGLILKIVEALPVGVRQRVKSSPMLGRLGSAALRRVVSGGEPLIVTVQQGANQGMKLAIDQNTPRYYWLEGHDEPEVVEMMRSFSPPNGTVIDVGAHVGIETLMLSRWVGPGGRVISIEADPATMGRLKKNLEINSLTNVRTVQKAISDRTGTVRFSADASVTSAITDSPGTQIGIDVPCETLDQLAEDLALQKIDLIKIDVEDHEVAVLRGAQRVLRSIQPALLIEIHSPQSRDGCRQILHDCGYKTRQVEQNGQDYLSPLSGAEFRRFHLLAQRT